MVLAEYKCGCTWVGDKEECIEYCQYHGEDRRRIINLRKKEDNMQTGWSK